MSVSTDLIQSFLAKTHPFDLLAPPAQQRLAQQLKPFRYRVGQEVIVRGTQPSQVVILYQGQIRLIGYDPRTQQPITLELLQSGAILGATSLIRDVPCESCIASVESMGLSLSVDEFLALLKREAIVRDAIQNRCTLLEVFDLLGFELQRRADGDTNLKALVQKVHPFASVYYPSVRQHPVIADRDRLWFVSNQHYADFPLGRILTPDEVSSRQLRGKAKLRLIGVRQTDVQSTVEDYPDPPPIIPLTDREAETSDSTLDRYSYDVPYASEESHNHAESTARVNYPFIRARGPLDSALACFQMLSQHWTIPLRRDVVRRLLVNQQQRVGNLSLPFCGVVADLIGLHVQLVKVPPSAATRIPTPAMIQWDDGFALIYEITTREIVLGIPEAGLVRKTHADFLRWLKLERSLTPNHEFQALLLKPTDETPQKRFGLGWFIPALKRYRGVLTEVLFASFFVQLFSLANPLIIQVIIDQVISKNSPDTLHVLGIFLVGVAAFEAILSSFRTYLFADTTNRIDMTLGTQVIDHLLRLPLRYFERRPVGELGTRINELENIRRFLTGTALTVVLDAVFSVVYVIAMVLYSWKLTLVALATVPFFVLISIGIAPIVRRQLRAKAERNAQTQSYLVEVLSGIYTVKAQNIELRARWQWQEQYARYVSTSFRTVITATVASAAGTFLTQLTGLLVIWVGAYLVLSGELSLGGLIAFRIIAGYVTNPLLRLAQLWQSFQEMGLSLERLADILDTPQEVEAIDRYNIPMPLIHGKVQFDRVTFQYVPNRPPQLQHINLTIPAGTFVGIVGTSGSGKSTLLKLLPRLHEPTTGRVLIDGFDLAKVDLYSLRQQIGIVPQETLLFDGSVQENIALTNPDASAESIIEAARLAAAHDFIMTLPNGYNTRVGERGMALSGGQRQRIAIARTLLQNPRLLILDEATSSLDYETERQVCENLNRVLRGRTFFFITHRLNSLKYADLIVVTDEGFIAEQGTHPELMKLQGRYYCLYQQQAAQR
jgi:ATP-binding cassette, subfamily B, bacterial HlyB/CyaB